MTQGFPNRNNFKIKEFFYNIFLKIIPLWSEELRHIASNISPLGQQSVSHSKSITIASDYLGSVRIPYAIRVSNEIGDLNSTSNKICHVSVTNLGEQDGSILNGFIISPHHKYEFYAGDINNYFNSFPYDSIGTTLLFILTYMEK